MLHRTTSLVLFAALAAGACHSSSTPSTDAVPMAGPQRSANPFDIAYRISWGDPAAHEYDIQVDVGRVTGDVVKLQLPVWSPGRYAPMFFARNVTGFTVTSGGSPVRWDREDGSLWRVYPNGASNFTVHYRVFANNLSGTFSVLDTAHANWNGPSLFMYVVDHKPDPVRLHIQASNGWHIVNGDARSADQSDYTFENYDRLVDTPTEVAPSFMLDTLRIDNRIYRSMVHHNGPTTAAERTRFLDGLGKIVKYENTVFDPPPLEMYTFLFNLGYDGRDGMEHLYSTQIQDRGRWTPDAAVLAGLSTAAHEYFHVWNMKRVRAALLGPFDYTKERYQPSLWVGEGWTQYYGEMALPRSGVTPGTAIYQSAANIIRANLTAPGRKEVSARMASFEAPFFDGATAGYNTDARNQFFSYYTKGAGIALYLDLFIRGHTKNRKSLDDAFRLLRDRTWGAPNASYYLQGRGYTEDDVEKAVSDAAGVNMHDWFEHHVGGTEDMDYNEVLAPAGMRLTQGDAWRLDPIENATPEQIRVRDGWVAGKTTP